MGDFLGATICMIELAVYMSVTANVDKVDTQVIARCIFVLALPHIYGRMRKFF